MNPLSRVVIVTSEYPPEPTVSGRMAADLASHLIDAGCIVTVIAPYPSRGCAKALLQPDRIAEQTIAGVRVVRVPSHLAPQSRFLPRIRESWSFGRWSARALRKQPLPDAIYSATWPMLAQARITAEAARLRVPHVTHVMDLYPESALLKVPSFIQLFARPPLLALDGWIARTVSRLAVISPHMRETYICSRGVHPSRVSVVPTWQDDSLYSTPVEKSDACAKYGLAREPFTFLYLGNIGPVAGVEHLVQSFAAAQIPCARLVIVGEGSRKEQCVEFARKSGAQIHFISDPDVNNVPLLQAMADVCLLPLRRGTASSSVPSKLSGYMLSGKPVLASLDAESESARLIREAQCGWIVQPEHPAMLAEKARSVSRTPAAELQKIGNCGRAYAREHLSKSSGVQRLAGLLIAGKASVPASDALAQETRKTLEAAS